MSQIYDDDFRKINLHPHGSLIQRNNCVHERMFAKVEHMNVSYIMIHKIKERIVITRKKKRRLLETVKQLKSQHISHRLDRLVIEAHF